jgi:hypothetical protein
MELYVAARRYFGWYAWRAFNLVVNGCRNDSDAVISPSF